MEQITNETEKATVLTVLHSGDVFLDGPVRRLRRDKREHRRAELREAFCAFMRRVDEEKADLVVFSGNLLDGKYVGDDTLTFLLDAFCARPHCHFAIAPGPSDPYNEESIYRSKRLPRNVHIFLEEVLGCYNFPELPLSVYGWGYRSESCTHAPLSNVYRNRNDRFTVLCGYTELSSGKAPLDEAAIAAFGAHYTALSGAQHDGFRKAGDAIYSYSGSFEGRESKEVGAVTGGYTRVRATKHEDGWTVDVARIPLDTYSYVTVRLDVTGLSSVTEARTRLVPMIAEAGYDLKTVLRVILCGEVPLCADFAELENGDYGVYSLWVDDRTVPTDTEGTLVREMNARGELYRYFYPQMHEGGEEDRARAARAFRIAYAALRGEDFAKR